MNNTFTLKKQIASSLVGLDGKLRFDTLLSTFQQLATFHSEEMGVGFKDLYKNSNALWIVTKIKLYAKKMPTLNETVEFTSYPTNITPLTFIREFTANGDMGGNAVGHSEWCVLDATTKSLKRSNSIVYPFDLPRRDDNVGLTFDKMRYDVNSLEYIYSYTVKLTDIDLNRHTNNVAYARIALNAFNIEEFENSNFTSFEIKFINQTYYNDEIKVYKTEVEKNKFFIVGKVLDKIVFSVIIE